MEIAIEVLNKEIERRELLFAAENSSLIRNDMYNEIVGLKDVVEKLKSPAPVVGKSLKVNKVIRFEVIDKMGRGYLNLTDKPLEIRTSLQDDGKTFKVFLED